MVSLRLAYCHQLIEQLKKAHFENRLPDKLKVLDKYRMLIIDEIGYLPNAVCNLGYQTQASFNALGSQLAQCCCNTQRQVERGFCDNNYNLATNTTAIIQNAHNDTDRVLARLDAIESSRKDQKIAEQAAEIQTYKQNATFGAMIDASRAEILRRTGHDCPSAAYIVQPSTPVNFPTNCCGTFNGWGGNYGGCGNGGCC